MYNKYTRDLQVKKVIEGAKRNLITGYTQDAGMDAPPAVARALNLNAPKLGDEATGRESQISIGTES